MLQRHITKKEMQGHAHQSPQIQDIMESVSKVSEWDQREGHLFPDRQHKCSNLIAEGRWHPLQGAKWPHKENLTQVLQKQSNSLFRVPLRGSEPQADPLSSGGKTQHSRLGSLLSVGYISGQTW